MKTLALGSQGLRVSRQGFGCMGLSAFFESKDRITREESISLIRKAYQLGITHFDTAQFYGPKFDGVGEEILGEALADVPREKVQIATKGGFNPAAFKPDGKPETLRREFNKSLQRLKMSYVDLFYLTRIDTTVPLEDTMNELKSLVEEGKIRYVGLSEASPNSIKRAHTVHPITAVQCEWSLMSRDYEAEGIATCRELGIGIVPYSPIGKGFLSGKLDVPSLAAGDFRKVVPKLNGENLTSNAQLLSKLEQKARDKNCSMAQLALAWVHRQGSDVCPIPGTSREEHLVENVNALRVELSDADVCELNEMFPVGAFVGERYPPGAATYESN